MLLSLSACLRNTLWDVEVNLEMINSPTIELSRAEREVFSFELSATSYRPPDHRVHMHLILEADRRQTEWPLGLEFAPLYVESLWDCNSERELLRCEFLGEPEEPFEETFSFSLTATNEANLGSISVSAEFYFFGPDGVITRAVKNGKRSFTVTVTE